MATVEEISRHEWVNMQCYEGCVALDGSARNWSARFMNN